MMRIITGMHRSGTSLVAQLLYEAGAPMGDPETFYRPDRWNPDGYFEQPDIHAINMPLINGPWGRLAYFWLPSEKTILKRSARCSEQIATAAERYRDAVVKECRFCLTLTAWQRYGAEFEKILICLREPHAVAISLWRRNRIPKALAFHLWVEHNRRILERAGGAQTHVVYYPHLLHPERYDRELASMLEFLNLPKERQEREALWARCVKADYNHARRSVAPESYPPRVQTLWETLMEQHQGAVFLEGRA
jgi:hypothetical protein